MYIYIHIIYVYIHYTFEMQRVIFSLYINDNTLELHALVSIYST